MLEAVAVASIAFLLFGFCAGIVRPSRPVFANRYAVHPDGRPPWPRWRIDPPEIDRTGTSFRVDHSLNLVILRVSSDPDVYLYPIGQVFDTQGQLLLSNRESVANTPIMQAARNRMFAVDRDGRWHEFELPSGFAEGLENHFRHVDLSMDHRVLEGCRAFAEMQGQQGLARWLAAQIQRSSQPGE
jgi:hypothetical protein